MGRWAAPESVAAALAGESGAREKLIAELWPKCFTLAASVIGDRGLAQDAAQEACVIVHQKVSSIRHAAAFDAWVYRIVLRESSRVRRRQPRSISAPYEAGFKNDDTASMDVWRAIADLPPAQRDVTVLFYFDDLTTEEIAGILGVPHATVRTRLARARERLRVLLGDYDERGFSATQEVKHYVV